MLGIIGTMFENCNALSFSMLLLSYSMFCFIFLSNSLICNWDKSLKADFYLSIRNQSTVIYFIHMLLIHIISLVIPISTVIGYLICVAMCMLMAYVIVILKNKFIFLKYLV